MHPGQTLTSPNGSAKLVFQSDGNLVVRLMIRSSLFECYICLGLLRGRREGRPALLASFGGEGVVPMLAEGLRTSNKGVGCALRRRTRGTARRGPPAPTAPRTSPPSWPCRSAESYQLIYLDSGGAC